MKTCACGLELIIQPVPGAINFPRRLICVACGPEGFRQNRMQEGEAYETPNDYIHEIASPADVILVDNAEVDSRY